MPENLVKMLRPLVSVIIPIHNGERFLENAVNSILDQNYSPIEIVAVDDGSTDSSLMILKNFGNRVRYYVQPNAGTGATRNKGVALSHGSFLAFLDQDDVWTPGKLMSQIQAFAQDTGLDAVFGYTQQFYDPTISGPMNGDLLQFSQKRPAISPSGILLTRNAFDRVGPFDHRWKIGEWADWYLRAVDCGLRMKVIQDVVTHRRIHDKNKGQVFQDCRNEYAKILKSSLDRRRLPCLGRCLAKK